MRTLRTISRLVDLDSAETWLDDLLDAGEWESDETHDVDKVVATAEASSIRMVAVPSGPSYAHQSRAYEPRGEQHGHDDQQQHRGSKWANWGPCRVSHDRDDQQQHDRGRRTPTRGRWSYLTSSTKIDQGRAVIDQLRVASTKVTGIDRPPAFAKR